VGVRQVRSSPGKGWTLSEPRYPRTGARSHTSPPGALRLDAPRSNGKAHGETLEPDDEAAVVICVDIGGEFVVLVPDMAHQVPEVHKVPRVALVVRAGRGRAIELEIGSVLDGKVSAPRSS